MVSYWMTKDAVEAKVMKSKDGHYEMQMEGEKYPFPGYPRGSLLFGNLSPLKHQIKNKIFNEAWKLLENGSTEPETMSKIKETLPEIFKLADETKFDMVPYERLVPPVKEIWRAMTVVEKKLNSERCRRLKEIICFILQEDDAYRFRFQWMCKFIPRFWKPTLKQIDFALSMLEHAEIVGDMKERQRLFRRILMLVTRDKEMGEGFKLLMKELDWKKLRLTEADKYFFRAKYFKVDWPEYQY